MIPDSILLIDDDVEVRNALTKYLRHRGFEVMPAKTAADAVVQLHGDDRRFDLIITDLRMPGVNGLTLLWAVRRSFPDLPVIVVSAYASPETRAEAIAMGAWDCLHKPVDTARLLAAIQGALTSAFIRAD